jgi:hypothetical protein
MFTNTNKSIRQHVPSSPSPSLSLIPFPTFAPFCSTQSQQAGCSIRDRPGPHRLCSSHTGICALAAGCFSSFFSLFVFLFLLLCCLRVHCDIHKSSYNISNISHLNSPPPTFSFISLPPFLEQFQQVSFSHLHACVHSVCTIFTLPRPFRTSSLLLLVPTPPDSTCSDPPILQYL